MDTQTQPNISLEDSIERCFARVSEENSESPPSSTPNAFSVASTPISALTGYRPSPLPPEIPDSPLLDYENPMFKSRRLRAAVAASELKSASNSSGIRINQVLCHPSIGIKYVDSSSKGENEETLDSAQSEQNLSPPSAHSLSESLSSDLKSSYQAVLPNSEGNIPTKHPLTS